METILITVAGVVGLLVCCLLLSGAHVGAAFIFGLVAKNGILASAAYIFVWILFFPVMLAVCIVLGIVLMINHAERQ